jgi:creatinine amidohydrolase
MADMNWKEIEKLGNQDMLVLFPLGVIEEHGPHLPLATDIYLSYAVCRKIKKEIESLNEKCLIAPPYYWGINSCTGAFPGSFSLKEETLKSVLRDIFENINQFGFNRIYCVNLHGDPLHTRTILESIRESNRAHDMDIKFLMEHYDLRNYNLTGDERIFS